MNEQVKVFGRVEVLQLGDGEVLLFAHGWTSERKSKKRRCIVERRDTSPVRVEGRVIGFAAKGDAVRLRTIASTLLYSYTVPEVPEQPMLRHCHCDR